MEQLENMDKIEALQTELGQFLVSMIPVPWEKICFYAECAPGTSSFWFAMIEKETDVICTMDFFWKRYESYPIEKTDAKFKIYDLIKSLYKAYATGFGQDKVWNAMYYTFHSDGKFNIDFDYTPANANMIDLDMQDRLCNLFFGSEYEYYWTKYPSTEIGHG